MLKRLGEAIGRRTATAAPQDQGRLASGRSANAATRRPALPPRSILSSEFRYVSADNTDVAKTFSRIRWERERNGEVERRVTVPPLVVDYVLPIVRAVR